MRSLIPALVLMLAPASLALAQSPDPSPVIAAERAFAADYPALGMGASFRKWAEPGAVMIVGGRAQTVEAVFPPDAPRDRHEPRLEWWPNFAGISRSGDLAFTTGGVAVNGERAGHFFTIWRKQADGSWRWVYDGGPPSPAADVAGPETEPAVLAPGPELLLVQRAGEPAVEPPPDWALTRVKADEARLAQAAAVDQKAAHLALLGDEGRLYVAGLAPATNPSEFEAALSAWPAAFRFGPTEGGGQSDYGDLVWTYGPAAWTTDGEELTGHYVRLWQRQEVGFRIVVAYLLPAPPPPDED